MPHHLGPAAASRSPAARAGDPRVGAAVRAAADALTGEPDGTVEAFTARLRRWWPDLVEPLSALYPRAGDLPDRLVEAAAHSYRERRTALRALDSERLLRPDWLQLPSQVGYVAYADRFAGDLPGVRGRLDYLAELGVTYLHLMPLLEPREGADDGGYAVRDFRRVRPDLGTTDDLAALADDLHERGMSLTLDLVLNHVAREHDWAARARAGDPRYRAYFLTFPDRQLPDAYEQTLPEVFPDLAPGSFTWEPAMGSGGAWVWTTFNSFQWDLDWSNPDVFTELAEVVLHLANLGVDCLRLDAVAFLWKRIGTDCQNQPEVHAVVQALRALARVAAPATVFKAEAIVSPERLPAYLGTGPWAGKVSDLAYHNSLMVQIWSSLASGDAALASRALAVPPPKPVTATWATYARCHDDIGWAVSDADAAAVGLDGHLHRLFLARWYRGDFPGSWSRGADFQADAATGDARTSGTAASLCGVQSAIESDDERALDAALGRLFLVHALVYGFGGIPLLYMGDELGQLNDVCYVDEPAHRDDSRWLHRPRFDAEAMAARHDPTTVAGRVFGGIRHLARVRAGLASLHAAVESEPVESGTPAVLALRRRHPAGTMVQLYNVSASWQRVPVDVLRGHGLDRPQEHLSSFVAEPDGSCDAYALPPYAAWWLTEYER